MTTPFESINLSYRIEENPRTCINSWIIVLIAANLEGISVLKFPMLKFYQINNWKIIKLYVIYHLPPHRPVGFTVLGTSGRPGDVGLSRLVFVCRKYYQIGLHTSSVITLWNFNFYAGSLGTWKFLLPEKWVHF